MGGSVGDPAGNHRLVAFSLVLTIASLASLVLLVRLSHPIPLTVVTTTPSTTSTPEVPVQLTANGLGRFTLGMPWSVAVAAGVRVVSPDAECKLGVDDDTGATIVAVDDVVVRIQVNAPGVRTKSDIGVGTPATTGTFRIPVGDNELVIGVYEGKVDYMWAQRVGTVVGC